MDEKKTVNNHFEAQDVHGGIMRAVEHGKKPDTEKQVIDSYLKELKEKQAWWAREATLDERINLLKNILPKIEQTKLKWAELDAKAKSIGHDHWDFCSACTGPLSVATLVQAYIHSLESMKDKGTPHLYFKVGEMVNQVEIDVFPQDNKEALLLNGIKGSILLTKGTASDQIDQYQALPYRKKDYKGGVSLVLGAGNYSNLTFGDVLHKLMVGKNVVICKIHPVLEYLFDIANEVLEPMITAGILRFVAGGSDLGKYLTHHPEVDNIHITGSDKTFEAIVYGSGEEGLRNKKADKRVLNKPISGELGCVSPVIVVPGDWSQKDIDYQAKNIISMLGYNEGYSCCAPRILILPKNWFGSKQLISKMQEHMAQYKLASNFYPGTEERVQAAEKAHPNAIEIGAHDSTHQPWIFAEDLDPKKEEYAFNAEVWAAFIGQVYLNNDSTESYLQDAVEFANKKLWGTLSATIILDSKTESELNKSGAYQQAIVDLRYGTVAINIFPGLGNAIGMLPWGGYPGSNYNDIQSGNEFVNNILMLENIDKSILHAPFHITPEPAWFITNKRAAQTTAALTQFTVSHSWGDLLKVLATSLGLRKQDC